MGEDTPEKKIVDAANVWGELDASTQKLVIEMFVGMAFRLVAAQSEAFTNPEMIASEARKERGTVDSESLHNSEDDLIPDVTE